jgi:hypothetical protein
MAIDDVDLGLGRLRALAELELPMYLSELAALVGIDSGSYTKAGVDRVGSWVAGALRDLGAAVRVEPNPDLGDTVVGELRGGGRGRILVIGHLDTVFDPGTAAARPFRLAGGSADWKFARVERFGTVGAVRLRVLQGRGIAVLPLHSVAADLKRGRLQRLMPRVELQSEGFRLLWLRRHPQAHAIASLAAELEQIPMQ